MRHPNEIIYVFYVVIAIMLCPSHSCKDYASYPNGKNQ